MKRQNLVIVRAGNNSLHPEWMKAAGARNWDIVVNYFGDDPNLYREADVTRIDGKGPKWPALHQLIQANPGFALDYEYIWLPDDDLSTTKADINSLFDLMRLYKLEVAQPALTWDSYFSHIITLRNKMTKIRFTNYVEVMAPCLNAAMLRKAAPLFGSNLSGWGLDFLWAKLAEDPENRIAIIDDVAVRHTRPVGGPNYNVLREKGISPWDELRALCTAHGLDEQPILLTYKAIRRNNVVITAENNRYRFISDFVLGYLPAVPYAREPRKMLRRMAGFVGRGLLKMPERVAERPLISIGRN
jgi:Protein of unknown function (DUF707)